MYLAVKLWRDTPNKPKDMPDMWPSEVKELGTSRELPSPDWLLMLRADYNRHIAKHIESYNAWAGIEESVWSDPDA